MIENFIEYMWYLLHTPLKILKKALNKWYILCRVFGKRFDEVKEDILRARDEGMVATCSHEMLPVHAADRRLSRYTGEEYENFRKRIANYTVVCRLGGTNAGVILAVKSLGYDNVTIKMAKETDGSNQRWAEFYVVIVLYMDESYPIGFDILIKQVRKIKEVGAKDNYLFVLRNSERTLDIHEICRFVLRGDVNEECAVEGRPVIRCTVQNQVQNNVIVETDLWILDGSVLLDGSRRLDANREVYGYGNSDNIES